MPDPRPLLIDLDGVLRIAGEAAGGVAVLFDHLRDTGRPACVLSNTTKFDAQFIREFLEKAGVDPAGFGVLTALEAARDHAREHYSGVRAYVVPEAMQYFPDPPEAPEVLVVGDLGDGWTQEVLDEMFRYLNAGAGLVAMHRNRYQKDGQGRLRLDAGAYIAALEYASGVEATLIGKPSPLYFEAALARAGGARADGFIMIGDDLVSDVDAAMRAGGEGVLILTGKTSRGMLERSEVRPDHVVEDLRAFIDWLESAG